MVSFCKLFFRLLRWNSCNIRNHFLELKIIDVAAFRYHISYDLAIEFQIREIFLWFRSIVVQKCCPKTGSVTSHPRILAYAVMLIWSNELDLIKR